MHYISASSSKPPRIQHKLGNRQIVPDQKNMKSQDADAAESDCPVVELLAVSWSNVQVSNSTNA